MRREVATADGLTSVPPRDLTPRDADLTPQQRPAQKRILILASFFADDDPKWIDDFCPRLDFEFRKVVNPKRPISWHQRGKTTPLSEWLDHWRYVRGALKGRPDCVITAFPQLAVTAAALLLLTFNRGSRLIAWNFNLGSLPGGWKRWLASRVLRRVDRFVVHSSAEIESYAEWLGVPGERIQYVPLNKGRVEPTNQSPIAGRYIVSMGSAHRDYATLVKAVAGSGIKTVIISKKQIVDSLPDEDNLIKLHGLTELECNTILGGAVMNVVPLVDSATASGQVTFTTSMRMAVPTIVTRCIGSVDYIRHGETGILVPPGDRRALHGAIEALWQDEVLARRIGTAGRDHADKYFSDEAAGKYLAQQIDSVMGEIVVYEDGDEPLPIGTNEPL